MLAQEIFGACEISPPSRGSEPFDTSIVLFVKHMGTDFHDQRDWPHQEAEFDTQQSEKFE